MTRHGFYSKSAEQHYGAEIWLTPDGREVKVTGTDYSIHGTSYVWTDKKYVGPVVKKVKKEDKNA